MRHHRRMQLQCAIHITIASIERHPAFSSENAISSAIARDISPRPATCRIRRERAAPTYLELRIRSRETLITNLKNVIDFD
jgi:hypothetical protein